MTINLSYNDDLSRVQLALSNLPDGTVRVERSTNELFWLTVRGGVELPVESGSADLDDFEFAADVQNFYRVMGPAAVDTFTRSESNGWGSDELGHAWGIQGGAAADYSVDGSAGVISVDVASSNRFATIDPSLDDADVQIRTRLLVVPEGTANETNLILRHTPGVDETDDTQYQVSLFWRDDQSVRLRISKVANGSFTDITGQQEIPGSFAAGDWWYIRASAEGTTLRAKAWPDDGSSEPDWQLTETDSEHTSGRIGVKSRAATGNTFPLETEYDDLLIHTEDAWEQDSITPSLNGRVWFKSIRYPFLNRPVSLLDRQETIGRGARDGVHDVTGRSTPVAVTDVRMSQAFELTLRVNTLAEARDMDLILASGDIFFVHVPAGSIVPGGYVWIDTSSQQRMFRASATAPHTFTLPCRIVAPPAPGIVGTTLVWQTVFDLYGDWNALLAANPTWADLLATVGSPDDLVVI